MSCKCAYPTDEYNGWGCGITGGECVFLYPNSELCAKQYDEGPNAGGPDVPRTPMRNYSEKVP